MKISVVVSTYTEKRLNDIIECFQSLRDQTLKPFEVFLVLDPVPDLISFYKSKVPSYVEIVVSPEKGLSNARNAGIHESGGDIVAFIDDDAFADPSWLENLARNYQNSEVMGVGGRIEPIFQDHNPFWFPKDFYWTIGCTYQKLSDRISVRNPIGCNMSFRKKVFDKVGLFSSVVGRYGKTLLAGEESEFSLRVLNKLPESKILCDPSAVVYHKVPKERLTMRYLIRRAYYEGVSKGLMKELHSQNNTLSTEQGYLKHLVFNFIPSRIKKIFTKKGVTQLFFSIILIFAVFIGYIHSSFMTNTIGKGKTE